MHRAFVITLGRELDIVGESLTSIYDYRDEHGMLPEGLTAEFLAAPIEGVGNLSRPVELMKQKLWEDIYGRLSTLLAYQPGASSPLFLDVYLVANFGEHLAANALRVVFDAFLEVIPRDFGTVFPPHRAGERRRWRLIPIVLLPARTESKRPRDEAIADSRKLLEELEERSTIDGVRDAPFDRVFIADALISAGVLRIQDLVVQAHNLLHFLVFAGSRRDSSVTQLLEVATPDLGAAFGCALASAQVEAFHLKLASRLAEESAQALVPMGTDGSHNPAEVLSSLPEDLERTKEDLSAFVHGQLELDGVKALLPLIDVFERLKDHISALFEVETLRAKSDDSPRTPRRSNAGRNVSIGSLVLLMAAGVFSIAHFSLGWTIVAALGPAAGFVVVAGVILLVMAAVLRTRHSKSETETNIDDVDDDLEMRTLAVASLQTFRDETLNRLVDLETSLRGLPGSVSLLLDVNNASMPALPESTFLGELQTTELHEAAYHTGKSGGEAVRMAATWIESLGGWREAYTTPALLSPQSLFDVCVADYNELGRAIVADDTCRQELKPPLEAFLSNLTAGLPCLLEFGSRAHLDKNGIRTLASSRIVAPAALEGAIHSQFVTNEETSFSSIDASCISSDVYVLSAAVDIHPDAIAVINPNE